MQNRSRSFSVLAEIQKFFRAGKLLPTEADLALKVQNSSDVAQKLQIEHSEPELHQFERRRCRLPAIERRRTSQV